MNTQHIHYYLLLVQAFLILGCAQFTSISGGTPDTTPPRLIEEKTFPKNKSTNFTSSEITLRFDEYFVLSNPTQKIFISPSLENDPDYSVKGKSLVIDLNNSLQPNTTYTINFGDAIKDLNANNILTNFTYVFSTGNYIDSLSLNGRVVSAKEGNPAEGVMVGLYNSTEDSIVSKEIPAYFSLTDKSGRFTFQNLKGGQYKVFALKDENRNYLFDLPTEQVGFLNSTVLLDANQVAPLEIRLFEEDYKKQSIIGKTFEYPGKLLLAFQRPVDKFNFRLLDANINVKDQLFNKSKDTVWLWLDNPKNEKFKVDVDFDLMKDTLTIYPYKKVSDTNLRLNKSNFSIDKNDKVVYQTPTPAKNIDKAKVLIFEDTIPVSLKSLMIDTIDPRKVYVDFDKKHEASYLVLLLPEAVTDIYQRKNKDTTVLPVKTFEEEYYGTLTLGLDSIPKDADVYLEVMQKNQTIQRVLYKEEMVFSKMIPGKYTVKVLIDNNKNEAWDTGNYYKSIQPEKIIIFSKPIEIRSNWEVKERFSLK